MASNACNQPDFVPKLVTLNLTELQNKHLVLRESSMEVVLDEMTLPKIISALRMVFYSLPHAHGIAAIQIGIPLRIAIINLSRQRSSEMIVINPILRTVSGRAITRSEGCLSLPGFKGLVKRRNKVTMVAMNEKGVQFIHKAVGYEAAVVQHEIDHMNGICFWDHVTNDLENIPLPGSEL